MFSARVSVPLFEWFKAETAVYAHDPIAEAIRKLSSEFFNISATISYLSDLPCKKLAGLNVFEKLDMAKEVMFGVKITSKGFPIILLTNKSNLETYKSMMRDAMASLSEDEGVQMSCGEVPQHEPVLLLNLRIQFSIKNEVIV